MLKILTPLSLAAALLASPLHAQSATEKTKCGMISPALNSAGTSFEQMYGAMVKLNFDTIIPQFTGERKAALIVLKQKQAEVLGPFAEYLTALEDAGLELRRCTR